MAGHNDMQRDFMFVLLTAYYQGDQVRGDNIGEAGGSCEKGKEMHTGSGKP